MNTTGQRGGGVIIVSFIVAFTLLMVPLPNWAQLFRPEWVAIVVIYWSMALPKRVSVGVSWFSGLIVDVIRGSLLGQHALALAVVSFLTIHLHQRIRVYPLWQQAVTIFLVMVINYLIILWIRGIMGEAPSLWQVLIPASMTAILWPAAFVFMRFLRRQFHVT